MIQNYMGSPECIGGPDIQFSAEEINCFMRRLYPLFAVKYAVNKKYAEKNGYIHRTNCGKCQNTSINLQPGLRSIGMKI
jgi:hypothetical protein